MTDEYLYANQWNDQTGRPMRSEPFLSTEEARERYETGGRSFDIVPSTFQAPGVPLWAMRTRTEDGSFTVKHYNAQGSITRIAGFRVYDGRLFHDEVIDYLYPDASQKYFEFDALTIVSAYVKPTGTSKVITNDKAAGESTTMEFRNVPIDSYWAERPAFGAWAALADPNYGDSGAAA